MERLGLQVAFSKSDPTGRYVRGWASVVSVDGQSVVDHQGDVISIDDLTKAAHKFISDQRVAKAMHQGTAIGEVVESVIVDDEFAKALGATSTQRGWWIGMQIHDDGIAKRIASGEYRAFSIGGSGRREAMS